MPLDCNESSSQKTLSITGFVAYVKENYNLSRERVTVFTEVISGQNVKLNPEFVFKGKVSQTTLNLLKVPSLNGLLMGHIL